MTVTRLGMVKKSPVEELPGPSTQRFVLARTNPGDSLGWVFLTGGSASVLLVTAQGMSIRFSEQDVRPMGLVAAGVNGIKLGSADQVIGAARLTEGMEMLALATNGKSWRVEAKDFPIQGRYGQGVQLCKLEPGLKLSGILVGKRTQSGLVHFRQAAAKSVRLDEIKLGKRGRLGQDLYPVKTGDGVVDVTPVQDGLAFWKKSGPMSRNQNAAPGSDGDEDAILEIVEENQLQGALPGLETAPAGELKPASRSKPAAKSTRQAAKGAKKPAPRQAATGAKKIVQDAPLLKQIEPSVKPASSGSKKNASTSKTEAPVVKPPAAAAPEKTVKSGAHLKSVPDKPAAKVTIELAPAEIKIKTKADGKAKSAGSAQPALEKLPAEASVAADKPPLRAQKSRPAATTLPEAKPANAPAPKKAAGGTVGKTDAKGAPSAPKKPASASSERRSPTRGTKTGGAGPADIHGWEQVDIKSEDLKKPAAKKPSRKSK